MLGMIMVPSRELASQVSGVLKPIAALFDLNVIRLTGRGGKKNLSDKPFQGRR